MNTATNDHFLWFGLSISVHIIILAAIFISLQNKPSLVHKPVQKQFAFKVPAPIVFYGHQMDPNKTPGSLSQTHQKSPLPIRASTTSPSQEKQPASAVSNPQSKQPTEKFVKKQKKTLAIPPIKKEPTLAEMFSQVRQNFRMPQKSNLF